MVRYRGYEKKKNDIIAPKDDLVTADNLKAQWYIQKKLIASRIAQGPSPTKHGTTL